MHVAVVGLGQMGTAIARRLLDAGHEVTVWNRSAAKADRLAADHGARVVASPAEVWGHAQVCVSMVADDAALDAVTSGEGSLVGAGVAGRVLVDMSTVSVDASARAAAAAEAAGIAFLRAPVSGNPSVVAAGNLGIMVSGPRPAFDEVEPLLHEIGPNVFYVGGGEEARVLKLGINLMIGGTAELMAEALVLCEANGLDRASVLEVMAAGAMGSPFVKYKTAGLLADDYTSTFSAALMQKDLGLVLGVAAESGVPLPVTELMRGRLEECIAAGLADYDFIVLFEQLRRQAGLKPVDLG